MNATLDLFVSQAEADAAREAQARSARDAGMAAVAQHAEVEAPGWGERAYRLLLAFLLRESAPFTSWHFAEWAAPRIEDPPDERAWGPVLQRAFRESRIERVGYVQHPDPRRHCAPAAQWRAIAP